MERKAQKDYTLTMLNISLQQKNAEENMDAILEWPMVLITIGYGDIVPVTETGRIVGAIVAFAGVISFMVITARIAAIFTRSRIESSQDKILQRVTMLLERLEKNARS